jgi:hypothetical protein
MSAGAPSPEDRKYRNYVIAGAVGGFLLPIAGMMGALVFAARGDERSAWTIGTVSAVGLIFYVILFALL